MDAQSLITKIRSKINALSDESIAVPYAAPVWQRISYVLASHILQDDPFTFYSWLTVRLHLICNSEQRVKTRAALETCSHWDDTLYPILFATHSDVLRAFGNSFAYATLLKQMYFLNQFSEIADTHRCNEPTTILEYGGGFGSLCHIIHQTGYSGRYMLCDLPVLLALQEFYLSAVDINAGNLKFITLEQLASERFSTRKSAFFSLWTLGQTPVEMREFILDKVCTFGIVFIVYKRAQNGINNEAYFHEWRRTTNHSWTILHIDSESEAAVGIRLERHVT